AVMHFSEGFAGHIIAVEVQVAVAAKAKIVEQLEMAELDSGTIADVAGEQAEPDALAFQDLEESGNAREDFARVAGEAAGEMAQVSVQELPTVSGGMVNAVPVKKIADDGPIRAAAEGDAGGCAVGAEGGAQCGLHGRLAGAAAEDQGAVDIEKDNVHA